MAKRNFRPQNTEMNTTFQSEQELTQLPVAVYYRQSTKAQVGNISTAIQTVDMVAELRRRGWKEENIILINIDEGVSGAKRIDEREGMAYLFELISDRKIGAVACQDEDRLFRDPTYIQVNIFIDTCRKAHIKVITPLCIYDFADPFHGEMHAQRFRFKCEMAADYLKTYVLGRLAPARQRLLRDGKWAGAHIPVGYMVDLRKHLPEGVENPNYKKFTPFEPFAEVVREYYRIFLECGGVIRKSMRMIRDRGINFPICTPPDGFKVVYQLKNRGDGFYFTRANFIALLTNPVYIGHWCYRGAVVCWDNHTPIVEEDIFYQVFHRLSRYTLTGEENPEYNPAYQHVKGETEAERPESRPLLIGLMYTQINGKTYRTGAVFEKRKARYSYVQSRVEIEGTVTEWTRQAEWVDGAIIRRFREKIHNTFNSDIWTQTINTEQQLTERERKLKQLQHTSIREEMQRLVLSLKTLTHPYLIKEVEEQYTRLETEKQRIEIELARLDSRRIKHFSMEQAYTLFQRAVEEWDGMNQEEQRNLLALFINRIEAQNYNRSGDMTLRVFWKDDTYEDVQLWHKPHSDHWTHETVEQLLKLFDGGSNQLEIAAGFPDLKWYQIFNEIKKHRGLVRFTPSWLGKAETYRMYEASGGRKGKASGSYWQAEELEMLRSMVERKAVQLEIMQAFPFRRWIYIKERVKMLFGKEVRVELSGVGQRLTYIEYAQQQKTQDCDPNLGIVNRYFLSRRGRAHDFLSQPSRVSQRW